MRRTRLSGTKPAGTTRTVRRADGVVCTHMVGYVTPGVVRSMHEEVVPAIRDAEKIWYVQTLGVTGFDPELAVPARPFLGALRAEGVVIAAAIDNPAVRMMARGLCFAAGIRLLTFETERDVEAEIAKRLGTARPETG